MRITVAEAWDSLRTLRKGNVSHSKEEEYGRTMHE
jgi:hypothetical protein